MHSPNICCMLVIFTIFSFKWTSKLCFTHSADSQKKKKFHVLNMHHVLNKHPLKRYHKLINAPCAKSKHGSTFIAVMKVQLSSLFSNRAKEVYRRKSLGVMDLVQERKIKNPRSTRYPTQGIQFLRNYLHQQETPAKIMRYLLVRWRKPRWIPPVSNRYAVILKLVALVHGWIL